MIRGLAAVEVAIGHLRAFFFVDYEQSHGGLMARIFYTVSGLHHEAVMIFFVLSGFLVGGSIIRLNRSGKWRWQNYLLRRLCRLWIVIIPALLLTLIWDSLGARLNPAGYQGAFYPQLLSGPIAGNDLSLKAFVGNLLFLQRIVVHCFGTNGPIWSLANEFWYYLLFPLGLQVVLRKESLLARAAAVVLLGAIYALLPASILLYGSVWLFGVLAFLALDHPATSRSASHWLVGVVALIALVAALLASRARLHFDNDFVIGAAFAIALPFMARVGASSRAYRRTGFALSEMSYTLYLVHFPLLAFAYFTLAAPGQWQFSLISIAMFAGILLLVMVYAMAIWWLFERNTDRLRAFVVQCLQRAGWRRTYA
ncbi:MAG: acyltransferase family protein [Sphingomonas bacterium]|nr:acyltransferase family protein [Sphingomonas bacterium]